MSEFWATLIGAAVGVIAGAFIQYIVQHYVDRRTERHQRAALKKEMQCNLQLISELIAESGRFRNAVNGDALTSYFGYLNYEKGLFAQAGALLSSGMLYRWFSIEQLKKVQAVSYTLNVNTANFVNQNITQRREAAKNGELNKVEAVQFVNYVESELQKHKSLLEEFIDII